MCGVLRRIHMTTGRNAFTLTTGKLFARRSLSFRSRSFPSFCPISFMCCTSLSLNSCNGNNQIIHTDYLNYQHVIMHHSPNITNQHKAHSNFNRKIYQLLSLPTVLTDYPSTYPSTYIITLE